MASNLWVQASDLGDQSTSDFAEEAAIAASNVMWALSGRKYSGTATVTERYVRTPPYDLGWSAENTKIGLLNGDVYNVSRQTDLWNLPQSRLRLRGRPVIQIFAVRTLDGTIVSPDYYHLVDHSTIQFDSTVFLASYAIEISYSYGQAPPIFGKMAARTLAIELAKAWDDDDTCTLPQRVVSITRQGVSMTMLDDQNFLNDLRTGIYSVDLFLKSNNPDGARNKARVFSPDVPRARRGNPKPLQLPASLNDIVVGQTSGTVTMSLSTLNAEYLVSEPTWIPEVTVYSYSGTRTATLSPSDITIDPDAMTITIAPTYAEVIFPLGLNDGGTYDLYAVQNGTTSPIVAGNISIQLYPTQG